MKIYQVTKIGTHHVNYNEDSILAKEITNESLLIAVMDGCSMGKDSHFASTLIKKVLSKICDEIGYKEFINKNSFELKEILRNLIQQLFYELRVLKNQLQLDTEELLSTLILGILGLKNKTVEAITIGDGLICSNGKYYEYEQDNKPDYIGYHLNEKFENWYQAQTQLLSLSQVKDISISSDGVFSFKEFDNQNYESIQEDRLIDLLMIDKEWEEQENMLDRKLMEIEKRYGLKSSDDISIIRIIF